ncbi:hypothetical protein [uncultured Phocaeicola sp.]|uniref:hypothetical protein n=1 Tax=uncultured Phocaeicola sp. TaxID=990718 RepID=UPI002604D6C2|nr:hypothetical protein [uncultured Phocaeicola sp.]
MTLYISLTPEDIEKLKNGEEVKSIPSPNCTYDNLRGVVMLNEEAFNRKFKKGESEN